MSAQANDSELTSQAATDLRCSSVTLTRTSSTEFLATGCGREKTYACDGDTCTVEGDDARVSQATDDTDDATADAVASMMTDMACACASAGLASHGSHSHSHSTSSHHHHKD